MKEYGSIEKVIASLDKTKYPIPEDYNYEGVRELFKHPDVTPVNKENKLYICFLIVFVYQKRLKM
jgi:hypothetical protein